jgi:hypothetical protein
MGKLIYVWFALKLALCSCHSDKQQNGFQKARSAYKVSKIGRLPSIANESSGLARNGTHHSLWTHNDSGGKPELYEIDYQGKLISTLKVPNVRNVDWEDLSQSPEGRLFIGDMGNNANRRQDLTIYLVSPENNTTPDSIKFRYADQRAFPPSADSLNFDCEAFFYYDNNLYLFSKNRSKTNHFVKMYELPARPGNYTIPVRDSIYINTQVTAADINPSGTTFALLTYGKILLFSIENGQIDFGHPQECIKIAKMQEEAIVFVNDTDLVMTNEQGTLYSISRR